MAERICRLGTPGPMRERLVAAILSGEKTVTSSLLADTDADGGDLPAVGDRLDVVDSEETPVATIELTAVEVIRLGDADMDLAREEGEGFKTVTEWRLEHERFWRDEVIPRLSGPLAVELTDETRIVVERFRLVRDS
jgi:uncharacterized protein YhfF